MAKRYCGHWIINVKYSDRWDEYLCSIVHDADPHRVVTSVSVKPPAHLTQAVDSAQAYDDTAHAALSFVTADEKISESELDFTDSGFRIRRKK